MSPSVSRPLPDASRYAVAAAPVHQGRRWLRRLMVGIVLIYVGFLILAPIAGLILGAFANGVDEVLAVFNDPHVLKAFSLTIRISLLVVVIQAVFGTAIAWMLVRDRLPGKS